jgi:hypothetical protein
LGARSLHNHTPSQHVVGINARCLTAHTLGYLLASVNLGNLFLEELVTLLTDVDDLLASHAQLGHLGKHLLRYLSSCLILGKSIGVVEGIIYRQKISSLSASRAGLAMATRDY